MKKNIIFTLFLLLLSNSFLKADISEQRVKEYDNLFEQIGEKRFGISNQKINEIKNPFAMLEKKEIPTDANTSRAEKTYTLSAIFDKKAKLNDEWIKLDNTIDDFKLIEIKEKSVVIKNEHSKKELFIRKNDVSKIKFSSK